MTKKASKAEASEKSKANTKKSKANTKKRKGRNKTVESAAHSSGGIPQAPSNTFNLDELRLTQDFAAEIGVKKVLTTVPTRKPDKQWFVRTRPGEEWRLQTCVIELKEERETYLVSPDLWPELGDELIPMAMFTAVNRQNVLFIWPIRLPGPDGKMNPWHQSAFDAAERAERAWVRVVSNMALGAYECLEATSALDDPRWPDDLSFGDIIEIAFKGRYIEDMDHPVVRRLRGAV